MAIPPVVVEFLAKGIPEVSRALKSIQTTLEQSERAGTRSAQTQAQERIKAASSEAKSKIAAFKTADREHSKALQSGTKEAEKAAKAEAKAATDAAKDKIKAWKTADREHDKSLAKGVAEAEKAAKKEVAAVEAAQRRIQSIRERSASMAGTFAAKQARQEAAARQRNQNQVNHAASTFATTVTGAGVSAGRTIGGGIQKLGSTVLQLGGGFSVADSIQEMGQLELQSQRFSNAAFMGRPGEKRIDAKELERQSKLASIATGIDAGDLAKGAHAFLAKTGNGAEALANMKMFGDIAQGTGANIEDVANAAGTLRIQNSDLTPDKMKSILLQTVRQGQKGSVEFSDLAGSVGKITRTAANYAGPQEENQAKLLGLAQLGMRTMSDPRAIATSLAAIDTQANKHWKQMQTVLGPGMFNEKGQIAKGPDEFIASIMEKTGGDTRKLQAMGFSGKSLEYFQALTPDFQKAGGGKAGADAIRESLKDAIAAPMGEGELQENVKNVMNTSAMQFEGAVRQLKMSVGEQLLPEFVKLVPVLIDLIPPLKSFLGYMIQLAEWASKNPFQGLALAMGALMLKEVAFAQIGSTIRKLIEGAAGGSGGLPGMGGAGGAASGGGAVGAAAGGLITLGSAMEIGGIAKTADRFYDAYTSGNDEGDRLAKENAKGGAAAEAAQAEIKEAKGRSGDGAVAASYLDYANKIATYATNPFGGAVSYGVDKATDEAGGSSSGKLADETIKANQTVKQFQDATAKATAALTDLAAASKSAASATSNSTDPSNRATTITTRTNK